MPKISVYFFILVASCLLGYSSSWSLGAVLIHPRYRRRVNRFYPCPHSPWLVLSPLSLVGNELHHFSHLSRISCASTHKIANLEDAVVEDCMDDDVIPSEIISQGEWNHSLLLLNETRAVITTDNCDTTIPDPSLNVSYFYLKNELGLSEDVLWKITFDAGSALEMTSATIKRKINVLREELNARDEDIRTILGRQPTILHLSADCNLAPTLQYLMQALDLEKDELRAIVVAAPSILTYRKETLASKINFFISLMGYSTDEVLNLWINEPNLVKASVTTSLVPKMRFFVRDLEFSPPQFRQVIQSNSRIFLSSLDNQLIPKIIYFLIMSLQMNLKQVNKILMSYPHLLDYSLERHLLPMAKYIMLEDLDFSPKEMSSILLKFPRFVSHSLRKLKHHVGYFRYELGLDASQVKRVLYQAPQLVGLNSLTLFGKVEYLQQSLQLTDTELRSVVAGMPTLLVLNSHHNLQPKIDFLLQSLSASEDSPNDNDISTSSSSLKRVRDAVIRLPTLLGYSMENRIRPRMTLIREAGLDPMKITVAIPLPEETFQKWIHSQQLKNEKMKMKQHAERSTTSGIIMIDTHSESGTVVHQQERNRRQSAGGIGSVESNGITHWTRERQPRKKG